MRTSPMKLLAPLVLSLFWMACSKAALPEDCRKACDRVTKLKVAPVQKGIQIKLHEIDERVERTEDRAKADTALLKEQLATPGPGLDPKLLKKLSPAAKKAVLDRQQWEEDQLKTQRTMALQRAAESVVEVKKQYDDAKTAGDAEVKKATEESLAACAERCAKRSDAQVQCLLKIQAIEDVEICDAR